MIRLKAQITVKQSLHGVIKRARDTSGGDNDRHTAKSDMYFYMRSLGEPIYFKKYEE